jgi:hypothetical protein
MKFIVQSFLVFLFISCNNSNTSTGKNDKTAESASDSLMHEILKQHDAGMAKMSKLSEAKNRIQHNLDSISKLPFPLQKRSVQYRMELDSVFNRLTFADSHMETWMNEFNMDSLKDDREKQIKYLESEKTKISHVNDEMTGSLHKVDSLLQKK